MPVSKPHEEGAGCANCGCPLGARCIGGGLAEDGEGFCSEECYDQHGLLGCPQEYGANYRVCPHPSNSGIQVRDLAKEASDG